jgi:hypothetical protein
MVSGASAPEVVDTTRPASSSDSVSTRPAAVTRVAVRLSASHVAVV